MPSKPSTAATLTKILGRTLYRRSALGKKLLADVSVRDKGQESGWFES
jgi:hypothetical protein